MSSSVAAQSVRRGHLVGAASPHRGRAEAPDSYDSERAKYFFCRKLKICLFLPSMDDVWFQSTPKAQGTHPRYLRPRTAP